MKIIPDLWITLISLSIFLVNYFIIKKLYVAPYLKLQDKRHELTEGLKEKADVMQAQASKSMDVLEKKLKQVAAESKTYSSKKRKEAQEQANQLINSTKQNALSEIKAARENVSKIFAVEKNKIIEKTDPLVEGIYKNILKV